MTEVERQDLERILEKYKPKPKQSSQMPKRIGKMSWEKYDDKCEEEH